MPALGLAKRNIPSNGSECFSYNRATMKRFFILFGLVVVAGCRSQKAEVTLGGVDTGGSVDESEYALVFALTGEEATAGDDVGFSLAWEDSSGSQTPVDEFALASSAEPGVEHDGDSVVVTVAGVHLIEATAVDETGLEQTVDAELAVAAGPTEALELTLSEESVMAGEAVVATVSGTDAYGNESDTDGAEWSAPEGVSVDGSSLTATQVGEYSVAVTQNDASAEAQWSVTAGPAVSVDLTVESNSVEAGDSVEYSVAVLDEYGNDSDAALEWALDPGVSAEDDAFTFDGEGVFVCTVQVTDSDLSDSETITIDSSGPVLTVENPDRAEWTDEGRITVMGTVTDAVSGVDSLTVADESVAVEEDGSFERVLELDFGVNIIESVASDADFDDEGVSNQSSDVRSLLYSSEWFDPDNLRFDALLVRMNEGPGGLDQLGSFAEDIMDTVDLESLLGGELYSTSGGFWIFAYDISMSATSVGFGDASLSVDAVSDGTLDLRLTISDLYLDFVVEGYAPLVSLPADGTVNVDAMYVDMSVRPEVVAGTLVFTDVEVNVPDPEGLSIEIESGLSDLAGTIGLDLEELVVTEMRSAVEGAVSGEVDGMLDGLLGDFGVEERFDVADNAYTLMAELASVSVDDGGMTLGMDTRVVPDEVLSLGALDGPDLIPVQDWLEPDFAAGDSGIQMGLSTDVLNQMMFALWQGGMLDQTLTSEDLGVDPSLLALLLPGVDDVNIATIPRLPPVFTPRSDWESGEQYDLTIGGMEVGIYDGSPAADSLVMTMFVATEIPVALGATSDEITLELGEASVRVDMTYAEASMGLSADTIEPLFGTILAGFIPDLAGDLSSIPLPSLDGFAIAIETTSMGGGDSPPGFWLAEGSLE